MNTTVQPADQSKGVLSAVADQMLQLTNVNVNVAQELILTTEDKVRLYLNEHVRLIEQRKAWHTPAGIVLTLVLSFVGTSFHDSRISESWVISKDTWQAFFMFLTLASVVWLGHALRQRPKCFSIEQIVQLMKKSSLSRTTTMGAMNEQAEETKTAAQ
jgi:hypothetical protein